MNNCIDNVVIIFDYPCETEAIKSGISDHEAMTLKPYLTWNETKVKKIGTHKCNSYDEWLSRNRGY